MKQTTTCKRCSAQAKFIDALINRLGCRVNTKGSLVMWANADMRWYAVNVAIGGLLSCERYLSEIRTILARANIKTTGDRYSIVEGVAKLAKRSTLNP